MWTNWVTIHQSYGLPRAATECRNYLEQGGVRVKIRTGKSKRASPIYFLLVPKAQHAQAVSLLTVFKQGLL